MKGQFKAELFLALLMAGTSSLAQIDMAHKATHTLPFREGRLLVKTIESADSLARAENTLGADQMVSFSIVPGLRLYQFDESISLEDAMEVFQSSDVVEYVEPDYYLRAAVQNDTRFSELWGMENSGQTGGTSDADINASAMWEIEDGDPSVVIGIIDTGIDYNHADLIPNLWRNSQEIPANGIDDDHNGYIDDVFGANTINDSGNPFDDNAHGTHVAGTIGAEGNNTLGVVGVAQDVKIASCKFLSAGGSGSTSDAIQCLQYFADLKSRAVDPVNIVATNNSWGSGSRSGALLEAIRAHENLGILFVAAAGNSSANNDATPSYPANYELSNIISVAATDHADRLASFSNYGKRTVHVGAPGVRILSTIPNQSYSAFSGTSMASPHVTGLVAVIKSRFPSYDYKQIKNLVISSGTPIAALQNTISSRRIRGADSNGTGALSCANQNVFARLKPFAATMTLNTGEAVLLSALKSKCHEPAGPVTVYSDNQETVTLLDTGVNGDAAANDGVYSLLWQPKGAGNYALDFGNNDIVTVTVSGPVKAYKVFSTSFVYDTISGTSLGAGDETMHNLTLPFPIHFNNDGTGFNRIYVSSNGTISFTTTSNPGYQNVALPTATASTLVAPYWDDLIPSGVNSNIYVSTVGTAPKRKYVIEWRNLRHYNTNSFGTFQVVFFEESSDIQFNYLDTNFNNSAYDAGKSATVGIQSGPAVAVQYSYNAGNIPGQSSLLFKLQE